MTQNKLAISTANLMDVQGLVELANSGYRGEVSRKGWTTEAHLIEGEVRIDIPSMEAMINTPGSLILKVESEDKKIIGCVYLHQQERGLYLGLLTVSPSLQAAGIGKQLLQASEEHARATRCQKIFMNVISKRTELIAWYERRGYYLTGEKKPFPGDRRFGIPTTDLEFVVLEKIIDS